MASVYDLKPKFQALLRPLCGGLVRAGVTANHVTLLACGLSIAYGAWLWASKGAAAALLLLPVFLFARMAFNAIDGMLAREFGQQSKLGAILNELTDVIADAALYLPFAFFAGLSPVLVVFIVLSGIIAEMTGVIGAQIGASRRYDGPFGKSDRAFFFGVIGFLLGLGLTPGSWSALAFVFAAFMSVFTIFNRASAALKELEDAKR